VICQNLKPIGVDECEWYEAARKSRREWRMLYHAGLEREVTQSAQGPLVVEYVCTVCYM